MCQFHACMRAIIIMCTMRSEQKFWMEQLFSLAIRLAFSYCMSLLAHFTVYFTGVWKSFTQYPRLRTCTL